MPTAKTTLNPAYGQLKICLPNELRLDDPINGSLRDELLNGEIFYSLAEAKVLIEAWRRHYNTVRPHSSLGYRPPAPDTAAMAAEATMH